MLTVGQKLWWVSDRYRNTRELLEVEVTKVGRKWADISNRYRVNVQTLETIGKGYSSPGKCYLSKNEYLSEAKTIEAWLSLHGKLSRTYTPPHGVTIETIETVKRLLFGNQEM